MKKLVVIILLYFSIAAQNANAQLRYYEDNFLGGVTVGGYSPPFNSGGTGSFTLNIAPGSSIRKAFLIAGRQGNASNIVVTLNGINYSFNGANQEGPTFQSPTYGGNSGVHIIDVTSDINPNVNNYTLTIPGQSGPNDRYNDFALYVAFNNLSMAPVAAAVFINTQDFSDATTYTLDFTNAIDTFYPVGLSIMAGYVCNNSADGEKVKVGNYLLGTIGNPDINSGSCGGPLGSFYYANNTLSGLSDDTSALAMSSSDALSDIKTKISNNTTTFDLKFSSATRGNMTNAIWAAFVTYNSPSIIIPMPVVFTQFSGRSLGNANRLDWTTASEINCDYFNIEVSNDGSHFTTCGSVRGGGNSTDIRYYNFTDFNPSPSTTYYRLKQVDYDGQIHYSNTIDISNSNYSISTVDVYNLQGQMVMSVKDFTDNSMKTLTPGVYMIHYHTNQGILVKKTICNPM